MSFSQLPPAVLSLIVTHLCETNRWLAPYATVNKSWNSVVEALTFRVVRSSSIEHLRRIPLHMNVSRWKALRTIDLIIQLPEYSREQWYEPENEDYKTTNNVVFSDSLRKAFSIINTWHDAGLQNGRLALEIQAISKSDYWHLGKVDRISRRNRVAPGAADLRLEASYLHLTGELPLLPSVSHLVVRGAHRVRYIPGNPNRPCCPRLMSGEAALHIMRACPQLEIVELELSDKESRDFQLRNEQRFTFAASLSRLPESVTQLKLDYPGVVPANHFFDPPAISLTHNKDAVSLSLNAVPQQLQYLVLRGVLSDDIFDISVTSTSWPQLRKLHIQFDSCTPSGQWMLELDPEDSEVERDADEDRQYDFLKSRRMEREMPARIHFPERAFRTAVNRDLFDDISLAAARATKRMPNLRDMRLSVGNSESGCVCTFQSDGRRDHRITWQSRSTTTYEPHPEVIAAWKDIFLEKTGELEVQILGLGHCL